MSHCTLASSFILNRLKAEEPPLGGGSFFQSENSKMSAPTDKDTVPNYRS
jgi:hypothetical protein